ncbi:glycosyl transferase 2 family protein [Collimonas fungivorans]|uniref:Glycosyl transferase 2 family protein n=1 Tax=Collimonas fungivorans TaxID=158899 RepID=A0A127P7J4_9BURK|nr:glycosyltransferase family 2 protein [Collimonas fungivorans]AMO93790.1 glycosyl transferase 2 family protein [Collimonas fungivorans]
MIEISTKLAIAIPTYNRSELLDGQLNSLVPLVEKYGIPIYISDNASIDSTEATVKKWLQVYPHIIYSKNKTNIGMSRNISRVLMLPDTEYVWLLSDDDRLVPTAIEVVLKNSEFGSDLIVVNTKFDVQSNDLRVKELPDSLYDDKNKFIEDLGWHITLISCLVVKRGFVDSIVYQKYAGSLFPHTAALLEMAIMKKSLISWIASPLVYPTKNISDFTTNRSFFDIFIKDWSTVISGLPEYKNKSKDKCILSHGEKAGIFTIPGFFQLRLSGALDFNVYKEYKDYFSRVTHIPRLHIFLISLCPIWLVVQIRKVWRLRNFLKRRNNKS